MHAAAASPTSDAEILSDMVECAHVLGKAAFEIARACGKHDHKGFFTAMAEFRHCFFAVRMGIRLKLGLAAGLRAAEPRPSPETEAPERERPERQRMSDERERDREGDYEPVSLPQFLKTLRGVAAAAERRKAQLPPEVATRTLPKLQALLAQAGAPPLRKAEKPASATALAVLARPPDAPPPGPRSRLLGSAAAPPRAPPWRPSD